MKHFHLTCLALLLSLYSYSQTDKEIDQLENQKKNIELEVKNLTDSIRSIDLKIAQLKSQKFLDKIKDSSLTAIARKGAKLKNKPSLYADIISTFIENKEVIILEYHDSYFEVCQGSLCGYMSEIWIKSNATTSEFIKSIETEKKLSTNFNSTPSSFSSSVKSTNSSSSSYKPNRYRSSRTYYRGSRGGCYYINSSGNKSYVSRSLCN
ncbi:hypothetical protein LCGC14_0166830 [marine sediment metagenome]|uniref:Uncharacterized protein n=1 Tax=marine sediment metagenome TaxID=412755 RepID=A0A0F9VA35_9ZZZZ|nr:hypothetical protein [Maribacter sp.]HDZ07080.1 hypothetical protein [Maribacter sp.]HEA80589.1 hypothetical protein [Maribacter sp.]